MAAGKFNMQKASGGVASITVADGVSNTAVVLPESGTVATTDNIVGFKNYIINGGFDVWQRGTSGVSTSSPVGPDMWRVWAAGANTNWTLASSTDFAPFSKKVGCGLKWWGDQASLASPIEHRIESINAYKLSGKKLTLSFLAKCSSNTNMNIELSSANSIDNFTGATLVSQQGVSLTTTTQLFSITFDLTNADVRYGCSLVFRPSVPSAIHWIAQVQLEEGSVATPFEQRPYGLELSLCQRYYETGYLYGVSYNSSAAALQRTQASYKCNKRITPSVTVSKISGDATNMSAASVSTSNFIGIYAAAGSSQEWYGTYTASAEL